MNASTSLSSTRRLRPRRVVGTALFIVLAAATFTYVMPRVVDLSRVWDGVGALTWRELDDIVGAELTKVLGELENVNVTLVPYRLRHRGGLRSVPSSSTEATATRSSHHRSSP